jgi:hypothetical protein
MLKIVMRLKKLALFLFALMFVCTLTVKAQVVIGAVKDPHPGAVLELESGNTRGLLLPRVSLTKADTWSLGGNSIKGMMVYNESASLANNLKGEGVYVWIGGRWNKTQETPCSGTPTIGTISVSKARIPKNEVFQAWVSAVADARQYVWTISGTGKPVGFSNTSIISLAGTTAGTVSISVKAFTACGQSNEQTVSVTIN